MFGLAGIIGGILLILIGAGMVFFFPSSRTYQPQQFNVIIIVLGFVLIILGGLLIFA